VDAGRAVGAVDVFGTAFVPELSRSLISEILLELLFSEVALEGFATSAFFGSVIETAFVATVPRELSETASVWAVTLTAPAAANMKTGASFRMSDIVAFPFGSCRKHIDGHYNETPRKGSFPHPGAHACFGIVTDW
jgi:hypothetical protein